MKKKYNFDLNGFKYSVSELAQELQVSDKTVYKRIYEGKSLQDLFRNKKHEEKNFMNQFFQLLKRKKDYEKIINKIREESKTKEDEIKQKIKEEENAFLSIFGIKKKSLNQKIWRLKKDNPKFKINLNLFNENYA